MKTCKKCNITKNESEFNRKESNLDGLRNECRDCQKIDNEIYRLNNPNKNREYYESHKEEILEKDRLEYQQNPEPAKQRASDWYYKNTERVKERGAKYREENADIIRERKMDAYYRDKAKKEAALKEYLELWQGPKIPDNMKICSRKYHIVPKENFGIDNKETGRLSSWCNDCFRDKGREERAANPEFYKEKERIRGQTQARKDQRKAQRQTEEHKQWARNYKSNPQVIIYDRISQRIRRLLKDGGIDKVNTTMELTGCDEETLLNHLKSTLPPDLTWEQFLDGSVGHVDHLKPACQFDLRDTEQLKKCFHYTNLRAIWAKDNLSKATEDKKKSIRNKLDNKYFSE